MAELNLVCSEADVQQGQAHIVQVRSLSIGLFRTGDGSIRALLNVCPHRGAPLCEGPQCGTTDTVSDFNFNYVRANDIVRCAWHGWEFDIGSGIALADPDVRARTFPVEVKEGKVYVRA